MNDDQKKLLADKLIVALDVDSVDEAMSIVEHVGPLVQRYKIGSRLFTAAGPVVLQELENRGKKVFLDLKYHDIPSVIGDAVRTVALKYPAVFMLTVHASGGVAMVANAAEAAAERPNGDLLVVAVTALTSLSPAETRTLGIDMNLDDWVVKVGELALEAGAHGLVCSPNELTTIRERVGHEPTIVTPGVRPADAGRMAGDDQARIATPASALADGASFLVMGRPIVLADDPTDVLQRIAETL